MFLNDQLSPVEILFSIFMFYNFIVWLYDNWRFGDYYSFFIFFFVPGIENQFARGTWASSCWKDNINDKKSFGVMYKNREFRGRELLHLLSNSPVLRYYRPNSIVLTRHCRVNKVHPGYRNIVGRMRRRHRVGSYLLAPSWWSSRTNDSPG